jgi:uncharacterized protein (TIGR03083 family)
MDTDAYLAAVRRDGDKLAATDQATLDLIVPGCPEWTVAQLLGHTGWVHRWVTAVLRAAPADPPSPKTVERAPADPSAAAGWYAESVAALLQAFDEVDLDQTFSTFTGPRDGRWWARRMAHEASVHRWDAQSAAGRAEPIDADLAVDGVDEALDTYVTRRFDRAAFGSSGQTLHLHATDIDGEWMLTMQPDALQWARAHGKGDTAVRGSASDLLLFVMSRRQAGDLEVFGDPALPDRWQAAANF